jgi:hypothetical protein
VRPTSWIAAFFVSGATVKGTAFSDEVEIALPPESGY